MDTTGFHREFEALTGHPPFPWQEALFSRLVAGDPPAVCDVPTGLGKTAVIPAWLIAVATAPDLVPRRLVYVVNRRTVVDQATAEAERIRSRMLDRDELAASLRRLCLEEEATPLAISTLRGQFADNAEWRRDPSRPSLIVGTIDMVGSRLLFSGYGCGYRTRPLHAGFLGQDVLLVHDEAHLEPAFQRLLDTIASRQNGNPLRQFRVLALSATARSEGDRLGVTEADRQHPTVQARLEARKLLHLHEVTDPREVPDRMLDLTLAHRDSNRAIVVFARTIEAVHRLRDGLQKAKLPCETLTGTRRGLERERLLTASPIFARFLRKSPAAPAAGTVFLVCTSAGEVGIDLSADHMVGDLTPLDSLVQRLGRVNRFGEGQARIDVVHEPLPRLSAAGDDGIPTNASSDDEEEGDGLERYQLARARTRHLLRSLPSENGSEAVSVSPAALSSLPTAARLAAFSPETRAPWLPDSLLDAWALTSLTDRMPGRPAVADWLHGVGEWEPPVTRIAWRQEVEQLSAADRSRYDPAELLDDYPLKPHELLQDRSDRIFAELEKVAKRHPEEIVWSQDPQGRVEAIPLQDLVARDANRKPRRDLAHTTVILPPRVGGLVDGLLRGDAEADASAPYDVADEWRDPAGQPRRQRTWDPAPPPAGMRLVRTLDFLQPETEEPDDEAESMPRHLWSWWVRPASADDDGSRSALRKQTLRYHLGLAEEWARRIVTRLGLPDPEAEALCLAARSHDLGKDRAIWQRAVGNASYEPSDPARVLAKSGGRMRPLDLTGYRHELGSLLDLQQDARFLAADESVQDLALHLVAAHHGRARPHFPVRERFDPERNQTAVDAIVAEVPRRFARLQRRYGHWGLAWLESLLRAADALASEPAGPDPADPTSPEGGAA